MGLCLFPDDDDVDGPDVSWSYSGFGGDRPWSDVDTALEPLLNYPDDHGELSAAECAVVLTRLETIIEDWTAKDGDVLLERHVQDARQLATVLRICAEKDVELLFG